MGADGQFDGLIYSSCTLVEGAPRADMEAAVLLFDAACRPADDRRIKIALAELALLCKSRPEDGGDTKARIAIIAGRLSEYPADVALEAIRRWGNSERWFPSWAELRVRCDLLGSKRMAVHHALRVAHVA